MAIPVVSPSSATIRFQGKEPLNHQMQASTSVTRWSFRSGSFPYSPIQTVRPSPSTNPSWYIHIDRYTGVITGDDLSQAYLVLGVNEVEVFARNADGTGSATFTLEVLPSVAPVAYRSNLKPAIVGEPYSFQLEAESDYPVTWDSQHSRLPAGITLDESGLLSGVTQEATGEYSFLLYATPENDYGIGNSLSAEFFSVGDTTYPIMYPSSVSFNVAIGEYFSYTPTVYSIRDVTFRLNNKSGGDLPSWVQFDEETGRVYGTVDGGFEESPELLLGVVAENELGATEVLIVFTESETPSPVVTTTELPDAVVGVPYSFQLESIPSNADWVFSSADGWIDVSHTGLLTGTPDRAGVASVSVHVAYGGEPSPVVDLTISVLPPALDPPQVESETLPGGNVGQSYSATLEASGSTPISWSATGLPAGISINQETGALSGTPTAEGSYSPELTAINNAGSDSKIIPLEVIRVATGPSITTTFLPAAYLDHQYEHQMVAEGNEPLSWSATGLPVGLSISSSGLITGSATGLPSSFEVEVSVSNNDGSDSRVFTLRTGRLPGPPKVIPIADAHGKVSESFQQFVHAESLSGYWVSSALPPGLWLDAIGDDWGRIAVVISGVPTEAGSYFIALRAVNPAGSSSTSFYITIEPADAPIEITTKSLGIGRVDFPFSAQLQSKPSESVEWSATELPAGLSLDGSTGVISGTPTQAGSFTFTVTAIDPTSTDSRQVAVQVLAKPDTTISNDEEWWATVAPRA